MKTLILILTLLTSACTIKNFNRSVLIASNASIACDYGQTVNGLSTGMMEENPILGDRPSLPKLTMYNTGAVMANTMAWEATGRLFGEKWKWLIPAGVLFMQMAVISSNAAVIEKPLCGVK